MESKFFVYFTFVLGFICFYIYQEFLFYHTLKVYCKKNKGLCENCLCWSCPRKLYIDEYRLKKQKENIKNK